MNIRGKLMIEYMRGERGRGKLDLPKDINTSSEKE